MARPKKKSPSTLFVDGVIRPVVPENAQHEAIGIRGDRISFIGSNQEADSIPSHAARIPLSGFTVVPGMIDAHIHVALFSCLRQRVNLAGAKTLEEAVARVKERVAVTPPGVLISGRGWNKNDWPGGLFPTRFDLDSASTDHPIVLFSKCGHSAWANSLALQRSNVTRDTADPDGGKVLKDEATGEPTGILFDTAESLLDPVHESISQDTLAGWIAQGLGDLAKCGITGVRTLDGVDSFRVYQTLLRKDELPIRVGYYHPDSYLDCVSSFGILPPFGCDRLSCCGLKAFLDGALGAQTAEMLAPYETDPANLGISTMDDAYLEELLRKATLAGLPVAFHAIGDKANRRLLDAGQKIRCSLPDTPWPRHSIEHLQLISEEDIPRVAEIGFIASMQPLHVAGDWKMADLHWGARSKGAYAFRSLLNAGARLAFGSDAPVEDPSPLLGLRAAITRTDLDCQPNGGWFPEEKISPFDALRAYTIDAAYAAGWEENIGSLEQGKKADFVVLDVDPLTCDPFSLTSERVVMTVVDGRVVYHRGDLDV